MKCIEDEIPFELPDGWAWCRIRNIASVKGGKRLPKGESFSDNVTDHVYIRVTDMKNRTINTFGLKYISEEVFAKIQSYTIGKNDLYVTIAGTIGVVGEVPEILDGMNLTENAVKVCNISINKTFLCYVMLSELVQQQFQDKTHQVAMPKLALERILGTLIPVCPVKEQQLIVFSIKSALQIADTIEIQKDALFELVSATKSKILDLAIRGKLVPQDPNDEPASVLLERIRAEKEELIKQGKIKRDKNESVIFKGDDNSYYLNKDGQSVDIGDEIPFDIPNSWEWTLLGNIVQLNPRNKISDDMEVSFVPMPLIDDGFSGNHISEIRKWNDVKTGFTHFAEGDIGVAKITPCFENRKSTVFKNLYNGYGAGTTELHILRTYADTISHKFLLSFVKTDYFIQAGKQTFSGAVGQQRIGKEYISNSLFPLPPLAEQKRIVNTIEALFAQIDKIAEQIS